MSEPCKHPNLPPVPYDKEACKGKNAFWVRQHYPRSNLVCPDCKQQPTRYASHEHYIDGDY